jgi:catechol 2,3-dioxygenase-like lactoylglutathione lyase family enzyme
VIALAAVRRAGPPRSGDSSSSILVVAAGRAWNSGGMKVLGIDHVQLAIPPGGEAQARRFYGEVLGLVEVPKPEAMRARGGLWFQAGPVQLHLGLEEGMRPSLKAHPALLVDDLGACQRALVAAGCEWKASDEIPGIARAHTRDPFGNRIELIAAALA